MSCVTIVGTGLLGTGIAEVVIGGGHQVVLHDVSSSTLDAAYRRLLALTRPPGTSLKPEQSLEAAVGCADVVIEAVAEDLALKQSTFERISTINRRALLMSNSSVLPIGAIALRTVAPERAVGTHWWNPPQLIPIVEVIRGPLTSEDAMQRTLAFHAALDKLPVRVDRDVPGFIGNRIQHALWREALALVSAEECDPRRVDAIVAATLGREFAACGPWEQMQRLGWPRVLQEFERSLPLINSEPQPARALQDKVRQGQLGAKTGQGFLPWEAGARERTATALAEHVARRLAERAPVGSQPAAIAAADEPIASRLRVAVWREAIALIDNQVCAAADLDRVVCNTIGLRLAAMGPVRNADYVGLDLTLAIHQAVLPSLESATTIPATVRRNITASKAS